MFKVIKVVNLHNCKMEINEVYSASDINAICEDFNINFFLLINSLEIIKG